MRDTQCPAKVLTVGDLAAVTDRVTTDGFTFDLDLILAAFEMGLNVREIPVTWEDMPGSTLSVRRQVVRVVRELQCLDRKYQIPRSAVQERAWRYMRPEHEFLSQSISLEESPAANGD
jgi:hypothetical protein